MNTKKSALPRLSSFDFQWALALLIVGILIAFAGKARAAVVVTGINLSELSSLDSSDIAATVNGRIGNGHNDHAQPEFTINGTTSSSVQYEWVNRNGLYPTVQTQTTTIDLTLNGGVISGSLNGDDPYYTAPAGFVSVPGVTMNPTSGPITSIYLYVMSASVQNWTMAMDNITLSINGGSGIPIANLIVGSNLATFQGVRIDLTAGEGLQNLNLHWDQRHQLAAGSPTAPFDDQQTFGVVVTSTSVPEMSTLWGLLLSLIFFFRRKRHCPA